MPVVVSRRPPPLPDVDAVVGGNYRLVRRLGEGMFGRVYVAERLDVPEHRVAIKLLRRSHYAGRNVDRELVMLATVGHPNVVQLKDHGTTEHYVWLTMPVYQGETLAQRLERGTLSPRQAYDIFLPVARGLEALHQAGLRHQDVKPENIYLAVFGGRVHPILLDLGVAAETNATFVAGTILYAAPEQVAALNNLPVPVPLSAKMDSYGLASTLLYALVGPEHFPGEEATTRAALNEAHDLRTEEPIAASALPDVGGRARELLVTNFRRWLARDPAARPTMTELAEQLDVLLEPEREEERRFEQGISRQRTTLRRFRAAIGVMLVIGIALAAVTYSKRETLQLAAQLEAARKKGAESFVELDTCVAAERVAQADLETCRYEFRAEQVEHQRRLDTIAQSGTLSEAERATEIQRLTGRVRVCEEAVTHAKRTYEEETSQVVAECARERAEIAQERDDSRALVEAQKHELAAVSAETNACTAERTHCAEDLKACRASADGSGARREVGAKVRAPSGAEVQMPEGVVAKPLNSSAESIPPSAPTSSQSQTNAEDRAPPPKAPPAVASAVPSGQPFAAPSSTIP